jgi:uncharacterized protein YdgA (DUF945 family)
MKSNKLKIIGIIFSILVIIQLATSYGFGFLLQAESRDELKSLEKIQGLKINNVTYKHNTFSTDIDLDINIDLQRLNSLYGLALAESMAPLDTKVHMHIQHGLFTGMLHGYLMPTLAFGQITIMYPQNYTLMLNKIFNKDTPLKITRLIYLNRTIKDYMTFAAGSYLVADSKSKISWSEMYLSGKSNEKREDLKFKINIPALDMQNPNMFIAIKDFKGNITQNYGKRKFIPSGNSLYKVDTIHVRIAGVQDKTSELDLTLNDTSYKDTTTDKNDFIDMKESIKIKKLIIKTSEGVDKYKSIKVDFAFSHLAAKPLDLLIESFNQLSSNDMGYVADKTKNEADRIFAPLKQNFAQLLINKPEFNLTNASVKIPDVEVDKNNKLPGGEIKITSNLKLNQFDIRDLDNIESLMKKILFEANIIVPQAMLSVKDIANHKNKFKFHDKVGEMKIVYKNGQLLINNK